MPNAIQQVEKMYDVGPMKNLLPKNADDQILNKRVVWLSSRLAMLFQRDTLRPTGLGVQEWRILVKLAQMGSSHLRALARESSVNAGHVSRMLTTLCKQGLVTKAASPDDKRKTIYALSDAGQATVLEHWPQAVSLSDEIKGLYSPDEFAQFMSYLDRAIAHIDTRLSTQVED